MQIEKAQESLTAAELCFREMLYNSTANRAYYAMFQAAVVALERIGVRPKGEQWSHEGVQATFAQELIRKRKVFQQEMIRSLLNTSTTRNQADYREQNITKKEAQRALGNAQTFVRTIVDWISYDKSTQRAN